MTIAFHSIVGQPGNGLFVFGDHASRHIPKKYKNLGLSSADLTRHIAWDIGTEDIVRNLCATFNCPGQLAGVSRLLIDFNRDVEAHDLIPSESDGTHIPGNQGLSAEDIAARRKDYHSAYHTQLRRAIDLQDDPLIVSIHSFTPKPRSGPKRPTDIGLLVKEDEDTARAFLDALTTLRPGFVLGWNKPYSAFDLNYTIEANVAPRGLRHLAIEIRQDHLASQDGIADIAVLLTRAIRPLLTARE